MEDFPLIRNKIILRSQFFTRMAKAGGKQAENMFELRPYDSRLIDSLIIQTRGMCFSPNDTALEPFSVRGMKMEECADCCSSKGMYAHCVSIPCFPNGDGCPQYKGVCGNCRRGGRAATCDIVAE